MYVNLIRIAYDGLVAQPLTSGRSSLAVVPDLATIVPEPSEGGRTYVFAIRPDVHYSTGEWSDRPTSSGGSRACCTPTTTSGKTSRRSSGPPRV